MYYRLCVKILVKSVMCYRLILANYLIYKNKKC